MKTNVLRGTTLVALVVLLCSFDVPKNWFAAGNEPDSYRMGTDPTVTMNGRHAATIQSIEPEIDGFGTLMQQCLPSEYAGKRVRMSGYMKSQDVAGWAGSASTDRALGRSLSTICMGGPFAARPDGKSTRSCSTCRNRRPT